MLSLLGAPQEQLEAPTLQKDRVLPAVSGGYLTLVHTALAPGEMGIGHEWDPPAS